MTIEVTVATVLSAFGIVLACLTFLYTRFGVHLALVERLRDMEVKVGIMWETVKVQIGSIAALVKAPTHFRMDHLVDKLVADQLTYEEGLELRELLRLRIEEPIDTLRKAATAVLSVYLEITLHQMRYKPKHSWMRRVFKRFLS